MEEAEHTPSSSNYRVSKAKVYLPMIVMLITGALDVILFKLQSQQEYFNPDKKKTMTFQHPFVQSAYSFLGELLCLLFYGIGIWYYGKVQISDSEEKKDEHLKRNINVMWLAIPALFDIVGSTLLFIALTLISASIYQMLRGFIMLITTMQSIIFLKRRYHRHHWFSLTLIVLGVGVVGASSVIYSEEENESDHNNNPILGIILIISSQIFTAGLMITEEKILRRYCVHPLKVVGWEGFWGFTFYIVILLVLQFIPWNQEDIWPYGTVENILIYPNETHFFILIYFIKITNKLLKFKSNFKLLFY